MPQTFNFRGPGVPPEPAAGGLRAGRVGAALGVKTKLEVVQVSAMVDRQVAGTFDIISHAQCLGGADLSATIRACFSINKTTGKKSDSNFTNFSNAEFNKILDQFSDGAGPAEEDAARAAAEPDPQQRDAQHRRDLRRPGVRLVLTT